jgi:hypothetical protein
MAKRLLHRLRREDTCRSLLSRFGTMTPMSDTRSNEPPQYHRIETSVRPVRVAGLIADLDDWISPAQRMIELFSRTWGGSGNVLFAYAENSPIPASQWRLLERYDPDRLGYYVPTYRGLQMAPGQVRGMAGETSEKVGRRK